MNKRTFFGRREQIPFNLEGLRKKKMNKRGISQMVTISLMVVFVLVGGYIVFKFTSGTFVEEGQKGGDRAKASDVCREEVKIRVMSARKDGDFFLINVENLKQRILSDFLIRYELGGEVEIKRASQILRGYENTNLKVDAPLFVPSLVKVIPQITMEGRELESMDKGWWLCSKQMAVFDL